MFSRATRKKRDAAIRAQQDAAIVKALEGPFAVIDFTPDGKILNANKNFCAAMAISDPAEVIGRHHSIFLFDEERDDPAYRHHWSVLKSGQFHSGEYRRRALDGREVWISAQYVPIRVDGTVTSVRKYATDVTVRTHAVDAIIEALKGLAGGDILTRLGDEVSGDYENIRYEFNAAADVLESRMRSILGVVGDLQEIADGSEQVSNELANRAEVQSGEVRTTTEHLDDIMAGVNETSSLTQEVNKLTGDTARKARRGEEIVKETVDAMADIQSTISDMTKTLTVIENFAFQTNLLAVNAAVEAARAGELGRGFAVVASEVRSLSQRSTEASSEISDLIRRTEERVSRGVQLAQSAGSALTDIGSAAGRVEQSVATVAQAAQAQTKSVESIEAAMRALSAGVGEVNDLASTGRSQVARLRSGLDQMEQTAARFSTRDPRRPAKTESGPERRVNQQDRLAPLKAAG